MRRALRKMGEQDASLYDDDKIDPTLPSLFIMDRNTFDADSRTYFVKTHALENDDRRAVYIVRDGRDALVSHAHYVVDCVGTDKTYLEVLEMLIRGEYRPFATWSQHVVFWLARNCLIVRYEDMVRDIQRQIQRVSIYCGIKPRPIRIEFDKLHDGNPNFYRRGIIGAWQDEMPNNLQELFWEFHGNAMRSIAYYRVA